MRSRAEGRGRAARRGRVAGVAAIAVAAAAVALAWVWPWAAEARRGRRPPEERGAELRAVGDVARSLDELFLPVRGPVTVSAARATYDPATGRIEADGDVRIGFGGWQLRCDHVSLSVDGGEGHAEGACSLTRGETHIEFRSADVALDSLEGVVFDAELDGLAGRYRFRAGRLRRLEGGELYVTDAWFTPCGCDGRTPLWSVSSRFVHIRPDGVVDHRRSWFQLGDRRVLPVPAGRFDAASGRAPGLLLPEVRFGGRQPFAVGLPVYLPLTRNTDLTLTPAYYVTRGFLGAGELRYAIGPGQSGQLSVSAIRDAALLEQIRQRLQRAVPDPAAAGYAEVRFWGQWRHLQLGRHALFGAQVDVVRDDMILADFEQDYSVRRTPYLTSRVWTGLHHGRSAVRLQTQVVDDLADVRNRDALHTLPRVTFRGTRLRARSGADWRVGLDVDADLAWHVAMPDAWNGELRHDDPYEDIGRDGLGSRDAGYPGPDEDRSEMSTQYETGEPVRRTLRGGLRARLGATWTPGGWLWLRPWAEARGVLYGRFRHHTEPGWLATVSAGAELGTALFCDFDGPRGGVRHVLEPRLRWDLQPYVGESVHPLLDYDDVAVPHHRIELGVVNRLQRRDGEVFLRTQPRRQALEVRASTALELDEGARFAAERVVEPLELELAYRHRVGRLGARSVVVWEREPFAIAGVQGGLDHPNGNRLALSYDWIRGGVERLWSAGRGYRLLHAGVPDDPIHELAFSVRWVPYTFLQGFVDDPQRLVRGLSLGAQLRMDLRRELPAGRRRVLDHEYSVEYVSPCACWRAGVRLAFASDWSSPSFGARFDLITR